MHIFRVSKGLSTTTCLNYVTNVIQKAKRDNLIIAGIFFDFSNAFCFVNTEILIETMKKMNFPTAKVSYNYCPPKKFNVQTCLLLYYICPDYYQIYASSVLSCSWTQKHSKGTGKGNTFLCLFEYILCS